MWTIECYHSEDRALGVTIGWVGDEAGLFIRCFGYELFAGYRDSDEDEIDGCGGNAGA